MSFTAQLNYLLSFRFLAILTQLSYLREYSLLPSSSSLCAPLKSIEALFWHFIANSCFVNWVYGLRIYVYLLVVVVVACFVYTLGCFATNVYLYASLPDT